MNMKKFLVPALALALTFSLVACGDEVKKVPPSTDPSCGTEATPEVLPNAGVGTPEVTPEESLNPLENGATPEGEDLEGNTSDSPEGQPSEEGSEPEESPSGTPAEGENTPEGPTGTPTEEPEESAEGNSEDGRNPSTTPGDLVMPENNSEEGQEGETPSAPPIRFPTIGGGSSSEEPEQAPEEHIEPAEGRPEGAIDLASFFEYESGKYEIGFGGVEDDLVETYYSGLVGIPVYQRIIGMPQMTGVASEFAFVQVKDSADVENVIAAFEARRDYQIQEGGFYPSVVENWENHCEIEAFGDYIIMAVHTRAAEIVSDLELVCNGETLDGVFNG